MTETTVMDLLDDVIVEILNCLFSIDIIHFISVATRFEEAAALEIDVLKKIGVRFRRVLDARTNKYDRSNLEVNIAIVGLTLMKILLKKALIVQKLSLKYSHSIDNTSILAELYETGEINVPLSKLRESGFRIAMGLKYMIKNIEVFDYLEQLSFDFSNVQDLHPEVILKLVKFICSLINLKDLFVGLHSSYDLSIVKDECDNTTLTSRLEKLSLSLQTIDKEIVQRLLPSQAEGLKELKLEQISDKTLLMMMFILCRNLEKLTIDQFAQTSIFSETFSLLKMEKLKNFKDQSSETNPAKVFDRFPNIDSLKCNRLTSEGATIQMLTKLKLKELCFGDLRNFNTPMLKEVKALIVARIDENWNVFASKNQNLECIVIGRLTTPSELVFIIEKLNEFQKLRVFKYFGKYANSWLELEAYEANNICCEIRPDIENNIVMVSKNFVQNYYQAYNILLKTFAGYRFIEI